MIFSYSAIKTEILSFAIMWTDLESIMLNEISLMLKFIQIELCLLKYKQIQLPYNIYYTEKEVVHI